MARPQKISHAWLDSLDSGIVELSQDWHLPQLPPLSIRPTTLKIERLERLPETEFAQYIAYTISRTGKITFILDPTLHPELAAQENPPRVYISGDFNEWKGARNPQWEMSFGSFAGVPCYTWTGNVNELLGNSQTSYFKFVTHTQQWLSVPHDALNAQRDEAGNINYTIDKKRSGLNLYYFKLAEPVDLSRSVDVVWAGDSEQSVSLKPDAFFTELYSSLPMGAIVRDGKTLFRIFAPRARYVHVCTCDSLEKQDRPERYELRRRPDSHGAAGVWELSLVGNLHGHFYWYHIDGPRDAYGIFDFRRKILDPYALATVNHEGPGIIIDTTTVSDAPAVSFSTPAWQNLVIAEAHVRDLAANAPIPLTPEERMGFSGLRKWVEHPDFYLHKLGINCVELQPLQEFDNKTKEEYHWGYMTVNFFSPASAYSAIPEKASGIKELQELVAAFHKRGIAVILDVVYNHVGEPAHLMFIDKLYYFDQDGGGNLTNWSGCGNDFRSDAVMARRLIIDSCKHLIKTFNVDGFRFDLAELLGKETLVDIEDALKKVKPDIVLIAEPWSFRGHIAGDLANTGWASWNDGYRKFLREFLRGRSTRETFEYYLKGSPWYYARWPAQTVNYPASHDDRTWMDDITGNPNNDGFTPSADDRRRTHLMGAILYMSIGIPMISAGADFLRSKHGVNNTYLRGDLNALDYNRIYRYPSSHAYFSDWIHFRLSQTGGLLRHYSRASEGFFKFHWAENSTASAILYNADLSQGPQQLLFAINPTTNDASVDIGILAKQSWRQIADHEHFHKSESLFTQPVTSRLFIPALSCALWICDKP